MIRYKLYLLYGIVDVKRIRYLNFSGPFMPGSKDVMLGYSSEGLFLRLYYPTANSNKDPPQYDKWFPAVPCDKYIQGLAKVVMVNPTFIRLLLWKAGKPLVPALYGEKISIRNDKIKCIVMSHGLGSFRGFHNCVCLELASWGYLVAIIEHRDQSAAYTYYYNSKEDALKDNRTMIDFKHIPFGKAHYNERNKQVEYRSGECSKVIEFLTNVNKGDVPENVLDNVPGVRGGDFTLEDLVGKVDIDNFIILGHSFGGGTSLYTLAKNKAVKCGVLLDPWMFSIKDEGFVDDVEQPLIFINTQTFHIAPNVKIMEKYYKATDKMYTIK